MQELSAKTETGLVARFHIDLDPVTGVVHTVVDITLSSIGDVTATADGWGTVNGREGVQCRIVAPRTRHRNLLVTVPRETWEMVVSWRDSVVDAATYAIRIGDAPILATWRDGEYLSGWSPENCLAAEMLTEIGAARYVSGWGTVLDHSVAEAAKQAGGLREDGKLAFLFSEAKEVMRPKLDAEFKRKLKTRQDMDAAFAKAKRTRQRVLLRQYCDECSDPGEECTTDVVYVYATPDGDIVQERVHTW